MGHPVRSLNKKYGKDVNLRYTNVPVLCGVVEVLMVVIIVAGNRKSASRKGLMWYRTVYRRHVNSFVNLSRALICCKLAIKGAKILSW